MAKTMTPSITDEQIDKAADQLRAAMRKHRMEVRKDVAQKALGVDNLGMRMFAVFCGIAESLANLIVRVVRVNRDCTPEEALKATGRKQHVSADVVSTMPKGRGGKTEVLFFKPRPEAYDKNGLISDDNLEKEFEFVGLKPVDPYSLAQANTDDPAFADTHPNGTHWKDTDGKWCFAAFDRWRDGRIVFVVEGGFGWNDYWWVAGVRK
ncbi:MAG TPA: hypothetical protein VJC13_03060 [Candidatus Paceibacterota bacterium]|nr:hypothetical protein [uncultured archaeon]